MEERAKANEEEKKKKKKKKKSRCDPWPPTPLWLLMSSEEEELYRWWTHRPRIRSAIPAAGADSSQEERRQVAVAGEADDYRPWSDIATPLLETLLPRTTLLDRAILSSVCRAWREFVAAHPFGRRPRLPWLMVPHHARSSSHARAFCSPSENVFYTITLPGTSGRRCCGSFHGWSLFADPSTPELFLINPVSKVRVDLPPWRYGSVHHSALSTSPTDSSCSVLVSEKPDLFGRRRVFFCRVGDEEWSLQQGQFILMSNVTVVGGKFYFLCHGNLAEIDVGRRAPLRRLYMDCGALPSLILDSFVSSSLLFLLESLGELLLVVLWYPLQIDILRADLDKRTWVKVDSLGDRSLFLGVRCCLCLSAAETGDGGNVYVPTLSEQRFCDHTTDRHLPWKKYKVLHGFLQAYHDINCSCIFDHLWDAKHEYSHWIMPGLNS